MSEEQWVTGNLMLRINGEPVEMQMTVPATPIKPQRMLPIFQQMSSAVVDTSVEATIATGKTISCKSGCGACCRQAVPISEVEAYKIAEIVESMDAERQLVVRQRFADALKHFTDMNWFEQLIDLKDMASVNDPDFSAEKFTSVVTGYFHEGVPCPFLEAESCSIHTDRPMVCREYLVTSPAENCSSPRPETITKVPIFLRPSKAMLKVGRTKNSENMSSLMLVEALDFVAKNPDIFEEKPGPEWAGDFVRELTNTDVQAQNVAAPNRKKKRWKK